MLDKFRINTAKKNYERSNIKVAVIEDFVIRQFVMQLAKKSLRQQTCDILKKLSACIVLAALAVATFFVPSFSELNFGTLLLFMLAAEGVFIISALLIYFYKCFWFRIGLIFQVTEDVVAHDIEIPAGTYTYPVGYRKIRTLPAVIISPRSGFMSESVIASFFGSVENAEKLLALLPADLFTGEDIISRCDGLFSLISSVAMFISGSVDKTENAFRAHYNSASDGLREFLIKHGVSECADFLLDKASFELIYNLVIAKETGTLCEFLANLGIEEIDNAS